MSDILSEKQDLKSKLDNLETKQILYNGNKSVTESLQKQLQEMQDIAADRDLIKSQYEILTQDFENKEIALQDEIKQLKADKITIEDESSTIIKRKSNIESELEDAKKKHDELKSTIDVLRKEVNESKEQIKHIETERQNLQSSYDDVKQGIEKNAESDNQLKDSKEEIEQLKRKLNLTLSNAKQLEIECTELDSLMTTTQEEKNCLSESNIKLTKQIASLKGEIQTFNLEAEKSIKNPWEGEEWEGLTSCEIYDMMKHDLVPAQQARLSKLCIEELEKQLEENKQILMKVLSEKEDLLKIRTKLDAKVCFLENSSSESLSDSTQSVKDSTLDKSKTNESIIAPSKFSKKQESLETDKLQTPANSRSLRRSSRSASKLATISLLKTPNPHLDDIKRSVNTVEKEEDSEKRIKVKTTDTESPAKVVKVPRKPNLLPPSKLAAEDRDPLSCLTNSPGKTKAESRKELTQRPSRVSSLRQESMGGRKKNPEECKQQ